MENTCPPNQKKDQKSGDDVENLIQIIEAVAKGQYSNEIMRFTNTCHSDAIRRIAEAMAMMMVKVEAREFQLEGLVEELRQLNARLKTNIIQTVITMANALGARDAYTQGHTQRVAHYAQRLARRLGLPSEDTEQIRIGAVLHDIGKIGFSDRLFGDEDTVDAKELNAEIQRHPEIGVTILKDLDFLHPVIEYVRYHHERIDGTGYPEGLPEKEIPLGAKIIGVADTFDAITTDRPYRKGKTFQEAFAILRQEIGTSFSKEIVEAFIAEIEENGAA